MGLEQQFRCDRCGYAQPSDRKFGDDERWMHTLRIVLSEGDVGSHCNLSYRDQVRAVLWCDQCVTALDVRRHMLAAGPVPSVEPVTPSLEDLIREIVREELPQ